MNIFRLLLSLLVLVGVGFAGLYIAEQRGVVKAGTVSGILGGFQQKAPGITNSLAPASQVLSSSSLVKNGSVLGSTIEIESNKPPIHQRAFEYARYLYCQQAVKDYEERFGNEAETSPLPTTESTPSPEASPSN